MSGFVVVMFIVVSGSCKRLLLLLVAGWYWLASFVEVLARLSTRLVKVWIGDSCGAWESAVWFACVCGKV